MVCINVIAADTDEAAEHLASSFYRLALGIITNNRKPMQPPINSMDGVWANHEKAAVLQMMQYTFIGSAETVKKGLQTFFEDTNVDEIMVASYIYDNAAKIYSYELIAPFFKSQK